MKVYLVAPAIVSQSIFEYFNGLKEIEHADDLEDAQKKARQMAKAHRGAEIWVMEAVVKKAFYAEPERIPVEEVEPSVRVVNEMQD